MSKRQMIEKLLEAFEYAISAGEPQECARQFVIWMDRVASALAGVGMTDEQKVWAEAQATVHFYDDDSSFPAHAESMKAILVGMLDKINQTDTSNELFITATWLPDDFYKELIEEINLAYKHQLPMALSVLIRKLFENLIIDILRKKYGTAELALYYESSRRRFQEFSGLLKNLDAKKADFHYISPRLDSKLISDVGNFRETGNSGAHSLDADITIENFDKAHINYLAQFLLRLLQNI